jgi:hypothetical protein
MSQEGISDSEGSNMESIAGAFKEAVGKATAKDAKVRPILRSTGTVVSSVAVPTASEGDVLSTIKPEKELASLIVEGLMDPEEVEKQAYDAGFEDAWYSKPKQKTSDWSEERRKAYEKGHWKGESMKISVQSKEMPPIKSPLEQVKNNKKEQQKNVTTAAKTTKKKTKSGARKTKTSRRSRSVQRNDEAEVETKFSFGGVITAAVVGVVGAVCGYQVGAYLGKRAALEYHANMGRKEED